MVLRKGFLESIIMPAIDQCEPQVIRAFEKAGWRVVEQPFVIPTADRRMVFADLRLEHTAVPHQQIIVAEIKCFTSGRNELDEFYGALGQYLVYRTALKLRNYDYPLFLVVPHLIYNDFFQREVVRMTIQDAKISLIVVNLEREEIVVWRP
jgi:hypothetical protein